MELKDKDLISVQETRNLLIEAERPSRNCHVWIRHRLTAS